MIKNANIRQKGTTILKKGTYDFLTYILYNRPEDRDSLMRLFKLFSDTVMWIYFSRHYYFRFIWPLLIFLEHKSTKKCVREGKDYFVLSIFVCSIRR